MTDGYGEDGESGLKLLGHRLYDPAAGRFIPRDPIGERTNWYRYETSSVPCTQMFRFGLGTSFLA